ncbi:hypothetical protein CspHIS471_0601740 [Cutaneotrichosporon sp. HIS471]|nr:hypothetical protein CspHIS471_0601740 [Cutaneotrichosporon sp. HIS471]
MSTTPDGKERKRKALVIGAGPVGSLTALSLHKRGWSVEVWDTRDDPRGREIAVNNLRSINLNISARGYAAVSSVDPEFADALLRESIPMPSRLIHHLDGRCEAQLYDPLRGSCSNSIHRGLLNQRMVEALPAGVEVRFNTKLARVEFEQRTAHGVRTKRGEPTLLDSPPETPQIPVLARAEKVDAEFDLVVGADGSWSKVRQEMMRAERIDFSQSFIPHAYIELHMAADPSKPGGFSMPPNHLHIWPRHKFMLIALPNKDGSFTLTLFIPFDELHEVSTRDEARAFFQKHFCDAWDIVGEKLVDDFMEHPRGNLVTISVTPSTYSSHAVLMGDACHSMVPFYGQGLNCGLEDVRILGAYLDRFSIAPTTPLPPGATDANLEAALTAYSTERATDLAAICDLALANYTEMRSSVLNPLYHLRRAVDYVLTRIYPSTPRDISPGVAFPTPEVKGWTALYDMVTFRPDIPYAEAARREAWQKKVVANAAVTSGIVGAVGAGVFALKVVRPWLERR